MKGKNFQVIIGYVGRDPSVKNLTGGNMVARFSVAVSESYKDRNSGEWIESTEWFTVVAWRYLAERVERDIKKGSPIYVEGKTKTERWKDEKTGEDRSQKIINAADLMLLGDRPRSDIDRQGEKDDF